MKQSTIAMLVVPPVLAIQVAATMIILSGNSEDRPATRNRLARVPEPEFKPIPVIEEPKPSKTRIVTISPPTQLAIQSPPPAMPIVRSEDEVVTAIRFTLGASKCMEVGVSADDAKTGYLAILKGKLEGTSREDAARLAATLCVMAANQDQCATCFGALIGVVYEEIPAAP